MRWAAIVVAGVIAASAGASVASADERIKKLKGSQPFWSWVADPHGAEIDIILAKATANLQMVRTDLSSFSWSTGALQPQTSRERDRALDDALGMLRYARKLSPKNRQVLALIADVAIERGATAAALDALETLAALPTPRGEPAFARHVALGIVLAQLGRWDEAATQLSAGISSHFTPEYREAMFSLALVEMERGRLAEAIDLLESAGMSYDPQVQLALAVAYDRGEQGNAASRILTQLLSSQTLGGAVASHGSPRPLRFAPTIDAHYFAALALEASGELGEARAAWLEYARAEPAPRYRDRALQHIADIDTLATMKPVAKPQKVTPGPTPRAHP